MNHQAELEGRTAGLAPPEPAAVGATRTLSIALVCPRFEPSFFGMEYALPLMPGGKRSVSFPGALPLLAALVPERHAVTIFDENIEALDLRRLAEFDVVGLTGMIVQRARMAEILEALSGLGPLVCVGGPYATVDEDFFHGRCDVVFIGEADSTWPQFLDDVAAGRPVQARYKQPEPTEMATLPTPRYDLVPTERYALANVQFSRGCPFRCEFCDIIVIFGRRPRYKTVAQIHAELDALRARGVGTVFFVDDNFIGNKAAARMLLQSLVEWQQARGFPLTFSTEASINVGDEPELLELMWQANFSSVFIGIESPRTASLLETLKVQNVRGDSQEAKLERIRDAGLVVHAGFIVGFDSDDEAIFDEQFRFVQRTGIGAPFVSVLSPIPSTPLFDRLKREGRLRLDDELVWFEPKLMSREQLAAGYHALNERLYSADAFFERIFDNQLRSAAHQRRRMDARKRRRRGGLTRLRALASAAASIGRFARELARHGSLRALAPAYVDAWRRRNRALGPHALELPEFLALCARHWHGYRMASQSRSNWGKARPAAQPGAPPV